MSSISRLQEHTGFIHSWKLCLNLFSFKWLKSRCKWVNGFNLYGSWMLKILLCTGQIKDDNLLLKIRLVLSSLHWYLDWANYLQYRENWIPETICFAILDLKMFVSCVKSLIPFRNNANYIIGCLAFHYFEHTAKMFELSSRCYWFNT